MGRFLELLRRVIVGDPRRLAREAQHLAWVADEADLRRFATDLRPTPPAITFGSVHFRDGTKRAVGFPVERLFSTHVAVSGASGSGKTTLALDITDQLLRLPQVRLAAVDPKGDFERGLREERFPLAAAQLGPEFAARVRFVRPFAGGPVPPLRFTARERGVPIEVQSLSLATALAEASGLALTPPAVQAFTKLARLAIELDEPLTTIVTWISQPEVFAHAARRSQDDRLRHYALVEFAREHRGMLRALHARLESVLLLPSVRAALEAPGCISFPESIEDHHLVIDLSHPPGGEESAVRILGGPLIGRQTRALLNREVHDGSPQVVFAIDELQELLTHYEAASFARLAALARSRRAMLICVNQQRVQLGPKLSEVLRTNAGVEAMFRCHAADAEALGHVLPVPAGAEQPGEARRALVRRMITLGRRDYLLWVKDGAVPAHFVRARKVDSAALRQAAAALSPDLVRELGRWSGPAAPPAGPDERGPSSPPEAPGEPPDAPPAPGPDSPFPWLG